MDIPLIEQAKIQARFLVPLVRTLQAELGEARANELVRKALGDTLRRRGETWWKEQGERDLGEKMAAGFAFFLGRATHWTTRSLRRQRTHST